MTFVGVEIAHRSHRSIRHSGSAGAQELCRWIFNNIIYEVFLLGVE